MRHANFRHLIASLSLLVTLPNAWALNIDKWTLDNGATVLLVEQHDNPIVDINVMFDAGSRRDDPRHIGVADFMGSLMDMGAGPYDEEALREKMADLSVSINSYTELEKSGLRIRSLSKKSTLNPTIDLANMILSKAHFNETTLEREKERSILSLKQALTQAGFIASRALTGANYPNHPYGFSAKTSESSIQNITKQQLIDFHQQYIHSNNAIIAMVGDINKKEATKIALQLLKGISSHSETLPPIPAVETTSMGQNLAIPHPATQAHIALGMPLITIQDPDYFALILGNYTLGGGGFDARLMKRLRDELGLTYGAYSHLSPLQEKGSFTVAAQTKKISAQEALKEAKQVLTTLIAEGPTEAELQQAKDNIIGGFPIRFDSNQKLLAWVSTIGFYDLPLDYLETYTQKINALTSQEIKNVWQKRIQENKINTVIVGSEITKK